jgi:hypothetical protein
MKNLLIGATICCVWLSGCNKKQYQIESPTYGKTTVEINGKEWKEDIKSVIYNNNDRFEFSAFKYKKVDDVWVVFEILTFGDIRKNKNMQLIEKLQIGNPYTANLDSAYNWSSFGTTRDDGDVNCDYYRVWESDSTNNWIQITKEKDNYKEVWGTYSVTFLRESGCASSPYTDTLRFRNGSFHFKFE